MFEFTSFVIQLKTKTFPFQLLNTCSFATSADNTKVIFQTALAIWFETEFLLFTTATCKA